ncbi:MAG: acetylglutamate kinase [Flavobacteriales bacterium AspAUS03]
MIQVLKIGGKLIEDESLLRASLKAFHALKGNKVLIHGGGKAATTLSQRLGIYPQLIDGRRVTDQETLDIVTMTYAGLINKKIVVRLQALGCHALGLSGADANLIRSIRRPVREIDYGHVGDLENDSVDVSVLDALFEQGLVPVLCALTHDGRGGLLNTNADTIASAVAISLARGYEVSLHYGFEKRGVLRDPTDQDSFFPWIDEQSFLRFKEEKIITDGMIPKLENAFKTLRSGVSQVTVGRPESLADSTNRTLLCL